MRITFHGKPTDEPRIRAGFIGCGSHAFRNVFPTFQFASVELVATCDLDRGKAEAFAAQFGARRAYDDHRKMLEAEELDAVFIVVGYDERGRPGYPPLTIDCLETGCHVWIEKPPAASCAEIEAMRRAAEAAGRHVMVGLKKMFFPANEKAKELMGREDFGDPSLVLLQYPQHVPTAEQLEACHRSGSVGGPVRGFLDHLCHPVSLMLYLLGMPESLSYERAAAGAGVATFRFASSAVASLALTHGSSRNAGMERTTIVGQGGHHIVVDNNLRVLYHRSPPYAPGTGYGSAPSYFTGSPDGVSALWEPEFSLGQLYNKGLFLLGYVGEIDAFARSVLGDHPPARGTLAHAWQATCIFEAFAEGPGKTIPLSHSPQETEP